MAPRQKCPCCDEWIENIIYAYEVKPGMYVHCECFEYFPYDLYLDETEQVEQVVF